MQVNNESDAEGYAEPAVTEVGMFDTVTKGQYTRTFSDGPELSGYWEPASDDE